MKWTELIDVVAERSGVPKSKARDVLTALVEVTGERLAAKEEVSLRGIGVFSTRWSKGRTLRSVESGRRMWVGGRFVPRFRPSKALKAHLTEETDQSWRDPEHQQAWRLAETLIGDLDLYHNNRIPKDLTPDLSLEQIVETCSTQIGSPWTTATQAYEERVPQHVRSSQNFLALAARRHWVVQP